MRPKQPVALKKLFSLTPTHPPSDKISRLWNKNFLTNIYRNIRTFPFKVFQECSYGTSRNSAVQIIFFDTKQKHVWWNIYKGRKVFGCVAWAYYFQCHVLRFIKRVMFFEWNCIVKWVIFFASFCWLWDFLLKNLKLKKINSDDVPWNV